LVRPLLAAAAGVAVVLGTAACGTGGISKGTADTSRGRVLFQKNCAGCHALAAVGSPGGIGPNLDDAFAQARYYDHYKESAIRNIVREQIRYPGQYATALDNPSFLQANMPANLVTGQDAEDVAAFVAANAGINGFAETTAITGTNGKQIFQKACFSCHTLKDAGTTGTVGPNLDQLKPPFAIVVRQVTNGGLKMPAFKSRLSKAQIDAVAKYVATHAGR
jgi:cbb3-type cytochrome c oxidase subunit III